jgi:hypothetical protein
MEVWERVKNKKHPLHGLSGGASDYNDVGDNSNGKVIKSMQQKQHHNQGHGEGQSQKQDKSKHKYPTFKYSSRLRGVLHEAILLNDEPAFLTYSNNHSKVVKQIEEVNRILIPPCIEEYPSYEPIEFKSLSEIERYEVNAKNETIDTLYLKIRNTVSLYIDQDEEIQNLVSADILWTYFQDLFPTTHYYNIVGRGNGIGKSSIGFIFEGIAYRAVRMTNPSVANVYRVLERIEAGQCTLVLDEADGVHEDRYMMGILKEGYSIGGKVPKVNMTTGKQEWFFSYGFKIIIAEDSLSPGTARGLIDRIFTIKAIKGKPKHDIKEVLHPGNRDKILEKLHNDLRDLRKLLLVYRMIHFDDPIVNRDVGLDGRDKELCKPLLQLFYGTDAYKQVEGSLMKFLDKKNKRKKNVSIDSMLYEIIVNLLSSNGERIYNSDIWQAIQDNIPGAPIDPKKPNEYQSYEYDTIYRKTAIKIIEGFGAEPDRDHNGRFLKFDLHTFVKSARQFDIDNVSLQSRLESVLTTKSHRHIVTSSRPENDINITGNGEAHIEIIKKSVDSNNKEAHDGVTVVTEAAEENSPYSCPYCDKSFHSEDLRVRHSVNIHKGWSAYPGPPDLEKYRQLYNGRSKVADMAAANMSGDGVMFGNGNGQEKDGVNLG